MTTSDYSVGWRPGVAPVAVVMISLNEGHNMEAVLQNLAGWAQEVFLVDSYSQDETVDIAFSRCPCRSTALSRVWRPVEFCTARVADHSAMDDEAGPG